VSGQADDQIGHEAGRYTPFFGTIFLFILISNLIGIIPVSSRRHEPIGDRRLRGGYLHVLQRGGLIALGPWRTFFIFGPSVVVGAADVPIEVISHCARMLSLTVRLYANMFAGEQVTGVFLSLTKFLFPVIFMGLHVFVGVIQAYIFMLLAMVYWAGRSNEH